MLRRVVNLQPRDRNTHCNTNYTAARADTRCNPSHVLQAKVRGVVGVGSEAGLPRRDLRGLLAVRQLAPLLFVSRRIMFGRHTRAWHWAAARSTEIHPSA
jgi:hypothetical protein